MLLRFWWGCVTSDVQQLLEEAIAPSAAAPQLVASPFSAA
jgi:hypothetical protein